MMIERLADQGLNHGLTADIQFFGCSVELRQHWRRKVHILDRPHHATGGCQKTRHVLLPGGKTCNVLRRHWLFFCLRMFFMELLLPLVAFQRVTRCSYSPSMSSRKSEISAYKLSPTQPIGYCSGRSKRRSR